MFQNRFSTDFICFFFFSLESVPVLPKSHNVKHLELNSGGVTGVKKKRGGERV